MSYSYLKFSAIPLIFGCLVLSERSPAFVVTNAAAKAGKLQSTTISSFALSSSTALSEKKQVFIDGEAGTTGIQVRSRLASRKDVNIISPPTDLRKDVDTRKEYINNADCVILCLPDDASKEAVNLVHPDNQKTVIIDASTAFRVDDNWVYGFPGKWRCASHPNRTSQ